MVKFKVKGQGTGYHLQITSARITKWSQKTANFPGEIKQPRPLVWHLTFSLTSKVKCQIKDHGCVSFPERLAVAWDHFGTRADDNFGTISGIPLFDPLSLTLRLAVDWDHFGTCADIVRDDIRYPVIRPGIGLWRSNAKPKVLGCVSYPKRVAVTWDHFRTRADVILVRYPVSRHLTLSFTLRLAVDFAYFGTRADTISVRYPIPWPLNLCLTLNVNC